MAIISGMAIIFKPLFTKPFHSRYRASLPPVVSSTGPTMSQEALKTALQETCAQRDTFKEHAEALTQEVLRLREQLGSHVAHTREAEQEHTAARAQWASKLEQAQRDFSEMLSREELESMRLQLIEQTEAPWRARVKALEAEVMAAREQANGHRRDAEKARSTADWAMHEHRATLREHEARAESEIAELKAKLEIAESIKAANEERAGGADRTRRLQREHAEATIRCQKLLEEVEELRRENDVLIATRSQLLGAQGSLQGESAAQARLAQAKIESLERRISHLTHELDASMAAQERLHEGALHAENEMRSLRAQVDDAMHATASERAQGEIKASELHRQLAAMRIELDRRHAEALRREATLQKSRDELAAHAAQSERAAAAALAAARDDESARFKRLEAERARLNEALVEAQSAGAAQQAALRDKTDALQGECAALKAELHGAELGRRSSLDEADRLRRRVEEAESRMEASVAELHALRLESGETHAHKGKLVEVQAQATIAQEKLQLSLAFAQKELASTQAQAQADVRALEAKLRHSRKLQLKEHQANQEADAVRTRQIEVLKREVSRLRSEREALRRDLATRTASIHASAGGGLFSGMEAEGGMSADLRALIAAESSLLEEASALKRQASGVARGLGGGLGGAGMGALATGGTVAARG